MKVIILAAGKGTRLGMPHPKCLTKLKTGETILERQISAISKYINKKNIIIVVGFQKERIMDLFPECTYVFNEDFENTNTSKSLLCALDTKKESDTIWMNGDIVFDYKILDLLFNTKESCMLVNSLSVAEEEVKYTVKKDGTIKEVSKEIQNGMGEAVGINKIIKKYNSQFVEELRGCENQDYFEKAIEKLIKKKTPIYPVDIKSSLCIEVDFKEDLELINQKL